MGRGRSSGAGGTGRTGRASSTLHSGGRIDRQHKTPRQHAAERKASGTQTKVPTAKEKRLGKISANLAAQRERRTKKLLKEKHKAHKDKAKASARGAKADAKTAKALAGKPAGAKFARSAKNQARSAKYHAKKAEKFRPGAANRKAGERQRARANG